MLIRINGQYLIFQPILKIKPKKHKSKIPVQRIQTFHYLHRKNVAGNCCRNWN